MADYLAGDAGYFLNKAGRDVIFPTGFSRSLELDCGLLRRMRYNVDKNVMIKISHFLTSSN